MEFEFKKIILVSDAEKEMRKAFLLGMLGFLIFGKRSHLSCGIEIFGRSRNNVMIFVTNFGLRALEDRKWNTPGTKWVCLITPWFGDPLFRENN